MSLSLILEELYALNNPRSVCIPSLWIGEDSGKKLHINYRDFIIKMIEKILSNREIKKSKQISNWSKQAVVYNVFVRFFTAYDHDQDGILGSKKGDITMNGNGIRETGTFLKTIALLPYLQYLGINTIHLLPITKIGRKGRKGNMGSPYAVKNPFEIDPNLADPILNIPVEYQYKAFIESAHLLGMKVVLVTRSHAVRIRPVTSHVNGGRGGFVT